MGFRGSLRSGTRLSQALLLCCTLGCVLSLCFSSYSPAVRVSSYDVPSIPESPSGGTETYGYQAEVSKMLDILINSLYTNKAIFLRELISNANDALDKARIRSLTVASEPVNQHGKHPTMEIFVRQDDDQIVITDGGIGMTKEELQNNLGTLGRSGTRAFQEHLKSVGSDSTNLIGQFGVGFYSVFLVAERVKVASKHEESEKQWVWESTGDGNFIIYEDPRGNTLGRGTEVIITLKEETEDFRNENTLRKEIFGFSAFVQYPIYLYESHPIPEGISKDQLDADGRYRAFKRVNDVPPVWFRPIGTVSDHDYSYYYKNTVGDFHEPLYWSHFKVEGAVDFTSLLYIPSVADIDDFSEDFNLKNMKLFVRRVFISDEFRNLLPRYLNFIKGVIDSDDLPLNVSREQLQESRILMIIRRKLVRKVLGMIAEVQEQDDALVYDPETKTYNSTMEIRPGNKRLSSPQYPTLWEQFGKHLRMGILEDQNNRARIARLLRYQSSLSEGKLISLQTYIGRMRENQKSIYYVAAESVEKAERSPLVADARARNLEVLYFLDSIDEFLVLRAPEFAGRKLINLGAGNQDELYNTDATEDRERVLRDLREKRFAPLLTRLQKLFGEKDVGEVMVSRRLNSKEPFIVTSSDRSVTARMANIARSQTMNQITDITTPSRILEINHRHPLVVDLLNRFTADPNDRVARDVAWLLYDSASVEADFGVTDSVAYVRRLNRVLRLASALPPNDELLPPDDDMYDVEQELEARRLAEEEAALAEEREGDAVEGKEEESGDVEDDGGFRDEL